MVLDGARLVVANPKIGSGFLLDVAGILKHRSVRIYHKARTKKHRGCHSILLPHRSLNDLVFNTEQVDWTI